MPANTDYARKSKYKSNEYHGEGGLGGNLVYAGDTLLDKHLFVHEVTPGGFDWGPDADDDRACQLAIALLAPLKGVDDAVESYHLFAENYVKRELTGDAWTVKRRDFRDPEYSKRFAHREYPEDTAPGPEDVPPLDDPNLKLKAITYAEEIALAQKYEDVFWTRGNRRPISRSAVRRGRTSGAYDTKTGHRLAYGDPRSFSSDLPGDEKRYTLVIILDRSGSMGNREPPKIRAATTAVARFALAAEQLDIDVAVIDFHDNEARLVKPFSVAVEYAQGALLGQETGGGTPLSDGLALGRTLVESQPTEPLIVTITDDKPRSVDAVETETRTTYAPVCSLTIATDCRRGDPPAKAQRLERVYDRTATVFDAVLLDDRLDQFASRLAGY